MLLPITLLFAFLPQAADITLPPPPAQPRYTTTGKGVQIYRCVASPSYQWAFQSPEATIFDATTNRSLGKHSAGPTWTWTDGSAVNGKLLQKSPAPNSAADISWLLLEAHPNTVPGALSSIAFIRRSNTQGGQAPTTGCDTAHAGTLIRVPYQATYTFYTAQ